MKLKSLLTSSIGLSFLTILGSVVSFCNQFLLANYFGASSDMDMYLSAISIPTFVSGIVSTVIGYSLAPNIAKLSGDDDEQQQYMKTIGLTAFGVAVTVSAGGMLLSGIGHAAVLGSEETVIRNITWITCIFQILQAYIAAVSVAFERFNKPVISNLFPYFGAILFTWLAHKTLGIVSVPIGLLVGTVLAVVFLVWYNKNELLRSFRNGEIKWSLAGSFLAGGPITAIAMTCFSSYSVIDAYFAPQIGEANLSYLGYSQRILIGVGNLIIAGPSAIFVPYFAKMISNNEIAMYRKKTYRIVGVIIALGAIVALMGDLCAVFGIRLLFMRGAFDEAAVKGVAGLFSVMLWGMIPMLSVVIVFRIYYCMKSGFSQMIVGLLWSVLYSLGSYFAVQSDSIEMTGYSYVLSWWICLGVLMVLFTIESRRMQRECGFKEE